MKLTYCLFWEESFDIMVEAEVHHIKDTMSHQSRGDRFIQTSSTKTIIF